MNKIMLESLLHMVGIDPDVLVGRAEFIRLTLVRIESRIAIREYELGITHTPMELYSDIDNPMEMIARVSDYMAQLESRLDACLK